MFAVFYLARGFCTTEINAAENDPTSYPAGEELYEMMSHLQKGFTVYLLPPIHSALADQKWR